jgi:hypothetical protein
MKKHTKSIKRGGLFNTKKTKKKNPLEDSKDDRVYNNITYPPGGGVIPELKCLVCSNNLFRLKTMGNLGNHNIKNLALGGVLGLTFTARDFKLFVCSKCGFHMHFSNKMSYAPTS